MPASVTRLGPYSRFEKPKSITVIYTEEDETTVRNISGYTAEARWKLLNQNTGTTINSFDCTLTTDGTDGSVTVPLGTASPSPFATAGVVELEVWVGNGGTLKFASEKFRFAVRDTVADAAPDL